MRSWFSGMLGTATRGLDRAQSSSRRQQEAGRKSGTGGAAAGPGRSAGSGSTTAACAAQRAHHVFVHPQRPQHIRRLQAGAGAGAAAGHRHILHARWVGE